MISFDPAEGSTGTTPAGAVITDGSYAIDASMGPTPGKYKVSIRSAGEAEAAGDDAPGPAPKTKAKAWVDPIPKQYNTDSKLSAEVQPSGSTKADFDLTTK